jgi:hypothetical protein
MVKYMADKLLNVFSTYAALRCIPHFILNLPSSPCASAPRRRQAWGVLVPQCKTMKIGEHIRPENHAPQN